MPMAAANATLPAMIHVDRLIVESRHELAATTVTIGLIRPSLGSE